MLHIDPSLSSRYPRTVPGCYSPRRLPPPGAIPKFCYAAVRSQRQLLVTHLLVATLQTRLVGVPDSFLSLSAISGAFVPPPFLSRLSIPPYAPDQQCLEIMTRDRADLMRLNQTLLDPDGFLPLRARAGIRLKRRASPTGRRGGGGGGSSRRRQNVDERTASGADQRRTNGIARLRALSSSGVWSDAKVFGRSNSTASASGGGGGGDDEDDDHPPLLDALVLKKGPQQQQQQPGGGKDAKSTPASMSSLATATITPKDQSTSSSWGAGSPWRNNNGSSSTFTPQFAELGWLSRIASGDGRGAGSPTGSASSFSFSGASTAEPSPPHAGMVMHFPPPPQSLLPTFDRELHGFDSSAPEEERWGELPFLVVESWGGLGEHAPPGKSLFCCLFFF